MRFLLGLVAALVFATGAAANPFQHKGLNDDTFVGYEAGATAMAAAPRALTPVASQAGCVKQFISVNFSSRGGIKPRILVLHYTVSKNTEGWGDVDLIRGLFNRDPFDASSNYLVDFEGHCKYIVDEVNKPWTQTFYNPYSISVEIVAMGSESREAWLKSAGLVKTARIFADAARRWDIPIRLVNPGPSCVAPPAGITDHEALDCQNSHTDVKPNFPFTRFMDLVKGFATPDPPPVVKVRFLLTDGDGSTLATSSAAIAGGQAEEDRLNRFLHLNAHTMALALRKDGDAKVLRQKVAP